MANNKFCTNCGFELPITAKFCERCGFAFVLNQSRSNPEPEIEPQETIPKESESKSELNLLAIIKKYFNGNFPLVKSYWMIALPINFVTGIVSRIFPYALIVTIPILILIFIGLWRSADNYITNKKKKENKFWGYFVKGHIVLAVILISLSVVFSFILGLSDGLSEESEDQVSLTKIYTPAPKTKTYTPPINVYTQKTSDKAQVQSIKPTVSAGAVSKAQVQPVKDDSQYGIKALVLRGGETKEESVERWRKENAKGLALKAKAEAEAKAEKKAKVIEADANVKEDAESKTDSLDSMSVEYVLTKGHELDLEKKYGEAFQYYKNAADRGSANAQSNLGYMYALGQGVTQSYSEAFRWYKLAADQGNASAQSSLGKMYEFGQGVTQSYSEAFRWYKLAADQGNARAQSSLGKMYELGMGVIQSDREAIKYYKLAADQGYSPAQLSLGVMYSNGQGVTQSYSEAVRWYKLAADQGYARAQSSLGLMYEFGQGVTQSYSEARKWYTLAANQDEKIAKERLDIIKNK